MRDLEDDGEGNIRWVLRIILTFFMACAIWTFVSCAYLARAQGGHAEMHDTYKEWTVPGSRSPMNPKGSSCCHDKDCRPTRAFIDDDGVWEAFDGRHWLKIPKDRVLPTDMAGDGRSHLCENGGFVYCFTPGPDMR